MRIRRHAWAVLSLAFTGIACSPANTGGENGRTLTLKVQGGGRIQGTGIPDCQTSCSATLASGTRITLTAAPDSGNRFTAWSGDCNGTGACTVTLDADRTVTATFSTLGSPPSGKHWLTVSLKGSGSVTSSPAGIDCGSTCLASFDEGGNVTLTATPASGFHFGGFGGACTGASCTVTMSADASVLASFEADSPPPVTHDLTVTRSGDGTGTVTSSPAGIDCGGTCRASFADGMDVTLSATAASESTFQGWQGACSGANASCKVHLSGDVQATAVFQLVAAADECAGLAPPPLPPAVTVSTGSAEYRGCSGGTSDGAGHVALPSPGPEGASYGAEIAIVDATGQKTGEATSTANLVPPLLEQEDGFEGSLARYHAGNVGIFALRPDGSLTSADTPGMYALLALDPLGGAAVVTFRYGAGPPPNSWLDSYDAHAAPRWHISLDRKVGSSPFVDRTGNILLLSTADDGSNIAQWVDHDGHKGPTFPLTGLSAWYGDYEGAPRVGSGVFLQSTSRHQQPYEWSAQLDSGATTWTPPPPWLTQRPDTKIHMAFGGRAYAMIDRPKPSTSCTQQIEVLAPSGKSCGKVSFPIRDGTCDTQSLDVGYDGTVVQLQPFDSFPQGSHGKLCTWRFWPRVFGSR